MRVIEIKDLNFKYEEKLIFKNFSLNLDDGNCYVLSGLNGCGKSTLLRLIAGKTLCGYNEVNVLGKDPFRYTKLLNDIAFLNNDWGKSTVAYSGYNIPIQSSLKVDEMMVELRKMYKDRSDELISVLGINLNWSLNNISEGQRKRVQLYLGLIKPFKVCLLDEITVNLDILVKTRLMNYLKKESIENKACIVYVTHIFDGLNDWCTQLVYLQKNNDVVIESINDIKNRDIFAFLLEKFLKEYDENEIEEEDNKQPILIKNAGGYTPGVLHDLKY